MRSRTLLGLALFTGALRLPSALRADPPEGFTLVEVKPGVFAAISAPNDADTESNAGFVVGSDAVLVVDAFATPRAAEQLLARIRQKTPKPIRWLIVTHHHLDHWGGDTVFAKAGATVVAQENAAARMTARAKAQEGAKSEPGRVHVLALPTLTYREALSIWLGDRRVDVFTRPGHTDGDSLVSVPDADVLFGGDLLQKNTIPNLLDAKSDAWIKTLDELAVKFPSAALVPGHGGVARPLDMRSLRDYLVTLRAEVARELRAGKSGDSLAAALTPELQARFRSWSGTEHIRDTVAQMERELTGTATAPATGTPVPAVPAAPTAVP
jgi:cyclase